ncbi:protein CBFA2T1-like isoform X1 [Paramormyrops kingsleyae]|uniref:RUNX1 partner transcriptional co-repressor 1 n=1 Tax=Paramormyrops kingsleyae TaxID=1676925 RepID=A0A3B3R1Z1_9TELE|nr:protein CBFA2T1-like isoform X1 [Paramormyrops kingsleyae]XP_023680115.1 protein CBFA2T1-like isoform X1 [Paramormyrops kingsleyae]
MPDSPADVKTQPRVTPPTMPPPPTAQAAPRTSSLTPPSRELTDGNGHSPTTSNGVPSPLGGFTTRPSSSSSSSSSSPSSSSSSASGSLQLPLVCGARQLSKLKRFLITLQQFGSDISPEIGEKVRTLVLGLVNSTLTIEEFHSKLQEATNFPLRPFVVPFLKANLPLLQHELLHCARVAKQNPAQYLAQHDHVLLDSRTASPMDSSELICGVSRNSKKRLPERTKENGPNRESLGPPGKRRCTISPYQPNGMPHPTPPPQQACLDSTAVTHQQRSSHRPASCRELRERARPSRMVGGRQEGAIDHRLTDREWAEEWRHLDHLLNCIRDMVERTRYSLTVLRRCQEADREVLSYWVRRCSDMEDPKKSSASGQSTGVTSGDQNTTSPETHRQLPQRHIPDSMPEEIWKKAEEAVNEVKKQAMLELQSAVSEAERKAQEMIRTERARMERTVAEARRRATDDLLSVINQQEDSTESCWNCGRKASETCSGCSTARYCGSFCQHKDWEKHHQVCVQTPAALPQGDQRPAAGSSDKTSPQEDLPTVATSGPDTPPTTDTSPH